MINVICAIAKNENQYINNWVNWHLNLGFDRIYLYDNNDPETTFVGNFIEQLDKVEIIDVRGKHEANFQNKCYNEFYNSHKFDWCAFIDIDEFIILNKWKTIDEFLSDNIFSSTNVIRLNWHMYNDGGMIYRDLSVPVYEAFTMPINHYYNMHGKEIIRGSIPGVDICSSHWCMINGNLPKQIMPDGRETRGKVNVGRNCSEAWVNHYMTKTLSEFIDQKFARTDAQFENRRLDLQYFWDINQKTPEKLKWLKEHGYNE